MRYARFESGPEYRTQDGKTSRPLRVAYIWKAPGELHPRRHRDSTGYTDTRANRRLWKPKLVELDRVLGSDPDRFDPATFFPRSRTATTKAIALKRCTLGESARRYLDTLAGDANVSPQTREQYRNVFETHILNSDLAKVPLAELKHSHIKAWLAALQTRTGRNGRRLEASTINKVLARLRTLVTLEWRSGEIPQAINPIQLVANLRRFEGDRINPFTHDELLGILAVTEGQQRALYTTLALTGMRPSEALGLWWKHIDLKGGRILVRQQLREDGSVDARLKTRRSRREVEMLDPVRAALVGLQAQNRLRGNFVFAGPLGRPLRERTQGDDPWRKAVARAGIEYRTLYTLRHTYASLMLGAGRNPQWVAHQLGHVDTKKLHEVYERWISTPAAERIDLDRLFAAVRGLALRAAKTRPTLPRICPESETSDPVDRLKSL